VPITLAYLGYKNKKAGVGQMIRAAGDIAADFECIKVFYSNINGLNSERQNDLIIRK